MEPSDKELLKRNYELALETNKMVHKMRRSQNWGRFIMIVWWLAIIAISGAAYYYYLQPYVQTIQDFYIQIRQSGEQAQNFSQQISSFFANWNTHATTTPQ